MTRVLSLDIGGANIKAAHAHVSACGDVLEMRACTLPYALWRNPENCAEMLQKTVDRLGPCDAYAVTMTGELCDCFATRREGVHHILDAVGEMACAASVHIWSVRGGFLSIDDARLNWSDVASANWHALATHIARQHPAGLSLLIDTGSTTTDIILLRNGSVDAQGTTDAQRLFTGELVYTGVHRTPLAALMNEYSDGKTTHRIMAERFATTADIHMLLGDIAENANDRDTADGLPMLREHAANRVLRMIGSDLATSDATQAMIWARRFADRQCDQIAAAIREVVHGHVPERVIVTGSGAFLASRAAHLALPDCEVVEWQKMVGEEASIAACATAMLHLWHEYKGKTVVS